MSLAQLILIAIVQGITEWLPISSSGHVLLAADTFGLVGRDEYLINAMAHLGTLLAVLLYFWRDVARAFAGGLDLVLRPLASSGRSANAMLAAHILASMPIALAAIALYEALLPEAAKQALRSVWTVGTTTVLFGLALWWADIRGARTRSMDSLRFRDSVLIGASQAVAALLPGTSRSGITMTLARALGYGRTEAARFSMLIGAPMLAAAGAWAFLQLAGAAEPGIATLEDGLIVAGLSFVSGYASIFALMALLRRMSFLPFVIYRLILGAVLLLGAPWLGLA